MRLRHSALSRLYGATAFRLQGVAQHGQRSEAFDPVQPWLDAKQCTGDLAVFLVRGSPPIHLVSVSSNLRQERLNAVGRFQADAQGTEQPQPVQRERLLQPLVKAGDRRGVQEQEFGPQPQQSGLRQDIGRSLVGRLERATPGSLLTCREVADDIFSLMPLTALDQSRGTEDRLEGLSRRR